MARDDGKEVMGNQQILRMSDWQHEVSIDRQPQNIRRTETALFATQQFLSAVRGKALERKNKYM